MVKIGVIIICRLKSSFYPWHDVVLATETSYWLNLIFLFHNKGLRLMFPAGGGIKGGGYRYFT